MSSIRVNDVFEELSEENKRLLNELMFANKCLNVLKRFKAFIDFNFNHLKTILDSKQSQKFEELRKEAKALFKEKENITHNKIHYSMTRYETIEPKNNSINSSNKRSENKFKEMVQNLNETQTIRERKNERRSSSALSDLLEDNYNKPKVDENHRNEEPVKRKRKRRRRADNNPGNRVFCDFIGCDKDFMSRDGMRAHFKTHFSGNSIVCEYEGCEYKTWRRDKLEKHINIIHKGVGNECNTCGKPFSSVRALNYHIMCFHTVSEKSYSCEVCNKIYSNELQLEAHKRNVHSSRRMLRIACDYPNCSFTAPYDRQLQQHILARHTNMRPFVCTVDNCTKTFKRKTDLTLHFTLSHKPERDFKCTHEGCDKAFKTKKYLEKHRQIHSAPELTYTCEWPGCDYQTRHKSALTTHKAIHNTNRDFVCDWPQCGKTFNRRQALQIHLRIHNCDKRYACHWPGCQYRCVDGTNMRKHMRVHQKN